MYSQITSCVEILCAPYSTSHSLALLSAPVRLKYFPCEQSFFLLLSLLPEAPLNFTAHATLLLRGWIERRACHQSWKASAIKEYKSFRRTPHYTGDVQFGLYVVVSLAVQVSIVTASLT